MIGFGTVAGEPDALQAEQLARLARDWWKTGERCDDLLDGLAALGLVGEDDRGPVANEAGLAVASFLLGLRNVPSYDPGARELSWRGKVVRRIRRANTNQEEVLLGFQRLNWSRL